MKTNNEARKYSSPVLKERLANVDPLLRETIRAKMRLAARIDDLREEKGWSRSQFAEKFGKRPSEITKWLSGDHNFTVEVLVSIAHVLGENLSSLFVDPSGHQVPIQTNQKVYSHRETGSWLDATSLLVIAKYVLSGNLSIPEMSHKESSNISPVNLEDMMEGELLAGNTQFALAA
jgi:transcriptional regulator with XRE-family HTH domain